MEDKESKEYKKRIREMVESLDKERTKDTPELYQELLEMLKEIKKEAKKKRNREYRNEKLIIAFVYAIREYYRFRIDPNYPHKEKLFQKEIDKLFNLVYEELRKPHFFTLKYNKKPNNSQEVADRKRIVRNMTMVLGQENMNADFFRKFKVRKFIDETSGIRKEIIRIFIYLIFGIIVIILALNGYDGIIG